MRSPSWRKGCTWTPLQKRVQFGVKKRRQGRGTDWRGQGGRVFGARYSRGQTKPESLGKAKAQQKFGEKGKGTWGTKKKKSERKGGT